MVTFPPAKINLGLQVVKKRPDGYHEIVTCFYPIPLEDILEVVPASAFSFSTSGLAIPGDNENNLCVKAYHLLKADFDLPPVQIHLHKLIPMGAGLGGGSSDGAWTLISLNELFALGLTKPALIDYANRLGSDVPFFIYGIPAVGRGRGEQLSQIDVDLSGKFLVLIKPDIHVPTATAYTMIRPGPPAYDLQSRVENGDIDDWYSQVDNVFEEPIMTQFPVIGEIKRRLLESGARYASMTGSGSAVYGIFDKP